METVQTCPECGATEAEENTCQDRFHQMLVWEFENPGYGEVHHLMVLCYHLQHPHLYSPEGLSGAMRLLTDFVAHGLSPEKVRKYNRARVDSSTRTWKIKGTPASHSVYDPPVQWTLTSASVIENGVDNYCASVRTWARSVYETLKASGKISS